tara:strand:- start:63 stop:359 length:297 start_codon:yes stop_codon:yes gene_type:complete
MQNLQGNYQPRPRNRVLPVVRRQVRARVPLLAQEPQRIYREDVERRLLSHPRPESVYFCGRRYWKQQFGLVFPPALFLADRVSISVITVQQTVRNLPK